MTKETREIGRILAKIFHDMDISHYNMPPDEFMKWIKFARSKINDTT